MCSRRRCICHVSNNHRRRNVSHNHLHYGNNSVESSVSFPFEIVEVMWERSTDESDYCFVRFCIKGIHLLISMNQSNCSGADIETHIFFTFDLLLPQCVEFYIYTKQRLKSELSRSSDYCFMQHQLVLLPRFLCVFSFLYIIISLEFFATARSFIFSYYLFLCHWFHRIFFPRTLTKVIAANNENCALSRSLSENHNIFENSRHGNFQKKQHVLILVKCERNKYIYNFIFGIPLEWNHLWIVIM